MGGPRTALMEAIGIAVLFALLSAGWIIGSDWLLARLVPDVERYALLSSYKGLAYTALLSILVGVLVYTRSRRQQTLREALDLSRRDLVTGLPGPMVANDVLEERLSRVHADAGRVGVALFDIQGMGRINRGMGRRAGDHLLRRMAVRLSENMPRNSLLSRLDGDKFLLIAPEHLDTDALARRAQVMVRQASSPLDIEGVELSVHLRAVVATGPEHGEDAMGLLDAADSALSIARGKGLSGVVRISELEPAPAVQLDLEADLRRALQRSELEIHFQPQYNLHTLNLVGAEALVRWPHPERGEIQPSEFIPMAESCGLIDAVTETVLFRVCDMITAWQAGGERVPRIAVNVSGLELSERRVLDRVRNALRAYPGCAGCLELEITETRIMENAGRSRQLVASLQAMGVAVAIDDFGTGYSSLSYLTQFPIDCLKIDRAFVCNAQDSTDKQAVLTSIATLGSSLGLRVLAEGVETAEELRAVVACGVNEAQGYYFAKSMSADAFRMQCLRPGIAPESKRVPV